MDSSLVTLISSIAGIILASLLVTLVKVITTFANKNIADVFNVWKNFVRKEELENCHDGTSIYAYVPKDLIEDLYKFLKK